MTGSELIQVLQQLIDLDGDNEVCLASESMERIESASNAPGGPILLWMEGK